MNRESDHRVTSAMVLGAGLGTRMRPLTDDIPKPMIVVDGRPLIDHILDRLARAGIANVVVNVHYKPQPLIMHLRDRTLPTVQISDETGYLLDTGGGIAKALPQLGPAPFVVHNCDALWMEDNGATIDHLLAAWDNNVMDCLLLLAHSGRAIGYHGEGDFVFTDEESCCGQIARRKPENISPHVYSGVSIMQPKLFDGAPEGPFSLNRIWDQAIVNRRLFGVTYDGLWMHVGTPAALEKCEAAFAVRPCNGEECL